MRSTLYNIPTNQDVLKASGVPFAVAVSPFAEIPGEEVRLRKGTSEYKCILQE